MEISLSHPDELFLDELVAGDGLAVELLAGLGVLERGVVAGHGRADGAPTDAVAGLVEAHERALEAAGAGEQVGGGDMDILQREAAGDGGAQAPFAVDFVGAEAGAVGFDKEAADDLDVVFIFDLGPDDGDVGDVAGGDPHFFAIENVLFAGFAGGGGHAAGIRAEAGLGQAEAAELFDRWRGRGARCFSARRSRRCRWGT